jgi:hypothetical protein
MAVERLFLPTGVASRVEEHGRYAPAFEGLEPQVLPGRVSDVEDARLEFLHQSQKILAARVCIALFA